MGRTAGQRRVRGDGGGHAFAGACRGGIGVRPHVLHG